MTMKHAIAFSLSLTLAVAGAMPPSASAQFDLDLQATEIGNPGSGDPQSGHALHDTTQSICQPRLFGPGHGGGRRSDSHKRGRRGV